MKTTTTRNQVVEHENILYQAIIEGNINTLEKLLHNDLLFIIPNGEMITKEIDLNMYREGTFKVNEIVPNMEALNIIDDVAVVVVLMELKGSYNSESFEAKYRYIRFWKNFKEGLKVIGGSGITV
ncbi:nuclear transport factor 2 family protein [Flavobacterium sp. MAHUQ-51]|uniref:nuclear transport factor 2 family protein n=1 Tax=Flavobacterium sp. GCM10022190 TaxID=3252639 RepID=UPI00361A9E8E